MIFTESIRVFYCHGTVKSLRRGAPEGLGILYHTRTCIRTAHVRGAYAGMGCCLFSYDMLGKPSSVKPYTVSDNTRFFVPSLIAKQSVHRG